MEPERLRPERPETAPVSRASAPERTDSAERIQRPEAPPASGGERSSAQAPSKTTPGSPKPGSSRGTLLKVLAVVFLAVLGWMYFGRTHPAAGAEEAAPNYQKNKNANPAVPAVLTSRDLDRAKAQAVQAAALAGNPLPGITNPSPAFIEAAKRGDVNFYVMRVFDSCAEDGDVVTIQLPEGGEIGPIPLTIAGTTISIPVVAGQPPSVRIVGIKDGVGGITVGAESSGGTWFSEIMPVGGTEDMLLSVQ
jgi:hypothetical protein